MKKLKTKDLLSVTNLDKKEIFHIFSLAKNLKKKNEILLEGKTLGMIFEKSSTRTRVSFEAGMYQLGGHALYLNSNDIQIGRGEEIKDTARVLSKYIDGIMIRAYSHDSIITLAEYSSIPIINGLTDLLHPCQALSDFFTILEYKKKFNNLKLGFIGDGNNMAHSLLLMSAIMGVDITIASPSGYEVDESILQEAKAIAMGTNSEIIITNTPDEAALDADILYTDVWVSMGQEKSKSKKDKSFKKFKIDSRIVQLADKNVIVMHCLPAHRGEEITDEIIEGEHSIVFQQAENRLYIQKAILVLLMS